ncbi:MAG: class I SAM-dependent methyltransferase [Sulfurimonas sp.]|nr:class I SAM-dependent methyltransferase [Sulfurimonas sp.]
MSNEKRFEFGKNWQLFLESLTQEKIGRSRESLEKLLQVDTLVGKTFIDIGSGSGLFSLSAYNLDAKVTSFDYDEFSVEATKYTREKFANNDVNWTVKQGDALDDKYIESLGKYDIVYSWGVLHHTGSMYKALDNASKCVKNDGTLVVAIYNTQLLTPIWKKIKKFYVNSNFIIKKIMEYFYTLYFAIGLFVVDILRLRNPFNRYSNSMRGMSLYTDVVDWIGGYPFETATPEEIFHFYKDRGFELENMITVGGKMGCNEFVFKKR